jgi:hypothetical protein
VGARATGHVAVLEMPRAVVARAGAMRHVAASELSCARRREPRDMQTCAPVLSFVLTLSLCAGISGLQGTDIYNFLWVFKKLFLAQNTKVLAFGCIRKLKILNIS